MFEQVLRERPTRWTSNVCCFLPCYAHHTRGIMVVTLVCDEVRTIQRLEIIIHYSRLGQYFGSRAFLWPCSRFWTHSTQSPPRDVVPALLGRWLDIVDPRPPCPNAIPKVFDVGSWACLGIGQVIRCRQRGERVRRKFENQKEKIGWREKPWLYWLGVGTRQGKKHCRVSCYRDRK